MEIVRVESKAFKQLLEKIDVIADYVFRSMKEEGEDGLVDSYEVCTSLKISTRTLQRLRAKELISFITVGRKHLYKLSEVKRLLEDNLVRSSPENFADLVSNHKAYMRRRLLADSSKKGKKGKKG